MKKISTVFVRKFKNNRVVDITDEITPGCEKAFKSGKATIKYDGACCAIIDGEFYKRYDAKKGKEPPVGAIPCCEADPITGHHPHWVKVDKNNPDDKWSDEYSYKIFVYAENKKIKIVQVDGDDGNGYYGTGYLISVKIPEKAVRHEQ